MESLGKFSTCDDVKRAFERQAREIRDTTVIVTGKYKHIVCVNAVKS